MTARLAATEAYEAAQRQIRAQRAQRAAEAEWERVQQQMRAEIAATCTAERAAACRQLMFDDAVHEETGPSMTPSASQLTEEEAPPTAPEAPPADSPATPQDCRQDGVTRAPFAGDPLLDDLASWFPAHIASHIWAGRLVITCIYMFGLSISSIHYSNVVCFFVG